MKLRYIFLFSLVFSLLAEKDYAQLTVVQGSNLDMTPLQLVQQFLVGQGVTVSNVTFNGSPFPINSDLIGSFHAAGGAYSELKFSDGIIMTSGKANIAIGPNGQTGAGFDAGLKGDPDLYIIADTNTNDAAILQFDFVPMSDTLRFRYVFGSEEFYEFCGSYNDAFGFFLSGPGISGTFSNNSVNIALMPNSTNYVTINNLCADPTSRWVNPPNPPGPGGLYYQYDGMSIILTAWHVVTPCSTYHIKLAIGDAVDHVLDSGVFLEKNSFSATSVHVSNSYQIPGLGNFAIEGCSTATVSFTLQGPSTYVDTLHFIVAGTATNGVDFPAIPDYVVFPVGSDSAGVVIAPILDGIAEGTEYVVISVPSVNCSGTNYVNDTVFILDNLPLSVSLGKDTSICLGTGITLNSSKNGGQSPYSYLWNTGATTPSIAVIPVVSPQTYWVKLTDGCGNVATDTIIVTFYPQPVITNPGLISTVCSASKTNIIPQSVPPSTDFTWTASCASPNVSGYGPGNGLSISQTLINTGTTVDTVIYSVRGSLYGCLGPAKNFKAAVVPSVNATFIPNGQSICSGSMTSIQIFSSTAGSTFSWTYTAPATISGASSNNGSLIADNLTNSGFTNDTVVYHVTPSNSGCPGNIFNVKAAVHPVPNILMNSTTPSVCSGQQTNIQLSSSVAGASFTWTASPSSGNITGFSPSGNTSLISDILFNSGNTAGTVTYQVTATANGCTNPAISSYTVTVNPVPTVICSASQTICSGESTVSVALSSPTPGSIFSWTATGTAGITGFAAAGNGSPIPSQILLNPGTTQGSVTYTITPSISGCTGINGTHIIYVNPLPTPVISGPSSACAGSTQTYSSPNAAGHTYSWSVTGGNITSGQGSWQVNIQWGASPVSVDLLETNTATGCNAQAVSYPVSLIPLPGNPSSVTGLNAVCEGSTGVNYSVPPIINATGYDWTYSGSGVTITNNGVNALLDFAVGATSGNLTVRGTNVCGFGPGNSYAITVNKLPPVTLTPCNDIVTILTAKPISLKGGIPLGGTFTGTGVTAGIFYPGTAGPGAHTITFTYTDMNLCTATASEIITVISPPPFFCNSILTDVRDNKQYPTVQIGTQCWMAVNLDYGAAIPSSSMQRDNCLVEKYCYSNNPANCTLSGGLYQWDELMRFDNTPGSQGICPPGWHVPAEAEWTVLFSNFINNGFAGSALKFTGYSGFNALLNGVRFNNSSWNFLDFAAMYWSSTSRSPIKAWAHGMNSYNPSVSFYPSNRSNAFPARCVKD